VAGEVEQCRLPALADEIHVELEAADRDWHSAVGHAIAAGGLLTEAKALVKHGEWLPWVAANFPGSERTAQLYMRLAANPQLVADLPTVREAVAMLTAAKPEVRARPSDGSAEGPDDEAIDREARARLESYWDANGVRDLVGEPTASRLHEAELCITRGEVCKEHAARWALQAASEAMAQGDKEGAAAASRVLASALSDPWEAICATLEETAV
jgi:hypothetical protein